jgi:hypothetical protein
LGIVDSRERREAYEEFLREEESAIEDLRHFVGGELKQHLNCSIDSLSKLDAFLRNLTADPGWAKSPLFEAHCDDVQTWLTVRVTHYLACCLTRRYGASWRLEEDLDAPFAGVPVLSVRGLEISPLEIARSAVERALPHGLFGVAEELRVRLEDIH